MGSLNPFTEETGLEKIVDTSIRRSPILFPERKRERRGRIRGNIGRSPKPDNDAHILTISPHRCHAIDNPQVLWTYDQTISIRPEKIEIFIAGLGFGTTGK
jgi:hypothetical protein